jgi:hypothetical protein
MFSLFNVRCWMFTFKITPYGINVTGECLQNNLSLMGEYPV